MEEKDLGAKIGNKEEAEWTKIYDVQEQNLRSGKIAIKVAETLLELAKKEIAVEKAKFAEMK